MDKLTPESDLIKSCLAGDKQAQELLYQRFAGKMMTVCLRYAAGRDEAQDMLQEGFIRVFTNLRQYLAAGSLEGWVRSIMVHVAIRKWHQQKKKQNDQLDDHFDLQDSTVSIIDQISAKELLHLIEALPDGYRMIFNMYVIDGFTHQEIAKQLRIQEGTSRSQLVKARIMLQKMLLAQQETINK